MPWLIGIDEAGYGPNLGPFVMTAVACRVPAETARGDLWTLLTHAVRRPGEQADGRLLIEDSKVVYTQKEGLACLEQGVWASSVLNGVPEPPVLGTLVQTLTPSGAAELRAEPWFTGATALPLAAAAQTLHAARACFAAACTETAIRWNGAHSVIVCPTRFNRTLDQWDSKGAVLGHALAELLHAVLGLDGDEPLHLHVDKHGGRNTYAAMLQDAVPDGMVLAHEESAQRSSYSVLGLSRAVRITFQPRADAEHFCVALASMVSKYVRELLMHEFNAFWLQHVPDLKPTAGYPMDAKRFWQAIQPAVKKLGLAPDSLWRRK